MTQKVDTGSPRYLGNTRTVEGLVREFVGVDVLHAESAKGIEDAAHKMATIWEGGEGFTPVPESETELREVICRRLAVDGNQPFHDVLASGFMEIASSAMRVVQAHHDDEAEANRHIADVVRYAIAILTGTVDAVYAESEEQP